MPIIPNSAITNQVLPAQNGQTPYVQQMNFGQMIGAVSAWNPDATAQIPIWINDTARMIYRRRKWFGCWIKGQLCVPAAVVGGSAIVTNGSNQVTGVGTSWTDSVKYMQFRVGYNAPIYTITAIDTVHQVLTLELPWGGPSGSFGYYIVKYFYNLGPNLAYLKTMVNMTMGFKFRLNLTQDFLNTKDPWRGPNGNFSWGIAPMPADPLGNYLVELYPASWVVQAFPWTGYVNPPNLVNDSDSLPPYISCDIVVNECIANALVWKGPRQNPYYDAGESQRKHAKFESELAHMESVDEDLYRTSVIMKEEGLPYYEPGGGFWDATHAVMAGGSEDW